MTDSPFSSSLDEVSPDLAFQARTAKPSAVRRQNCVDAELCERKSSYFVYALCSPAEAQQLSRVQRSELSILSGAFSMWPARTFTAFVSLRGLAEPVQAVKSQMSIYGTIAPLSIVMQSQWQQTRGMAVPKRKVWLSALTDTSLWRLLRLAKLSHLALLQTSPSRRGHRSAMKFHQFVTAIAKCRYNDLL